MITIQFTDFAPQLDSRATIEEQIQAMNAWLSSRPDINVVNIETIVLPQTKTDPEHDPYLSGRPRLSDRPQVIRVWYEGEQ